MVDLKGKIIGKWEVVSYSHKDRYHNWVCKCSCGVEKVLTTSYINRLTEHSKCMSCYQQDNKLRLVERNQANSTHGESRTNLFKRWDLIRRRVKSKPNYLKLGIKVCKEWDASYTSFRDWAVKNGFHSSLTLDRIDPVGDYEPDNCRWVTHTVQQYNKQHNLKTTYGASARLLARANGITDAAFDRRLAKGWDLEKAYTYPLRKNINGKYVTC